MQLQLNKNITTKHYIMGKLEQLSEGANIRKLSLDDLAKVPIIYGSLDPNIEITSLDNNDSFETSLGNIYGIDLKALTMLLYMYSRSSYVEFPKNSPQYRNPIQSAATPLALLGWRRSKNISYASWKKLSNLEYKDGNLVCSDPIKLAKLDSYLGRGLATTEYKDGEIILKKDWGLAALAACGEFKPDRRTIKYLREQGTYVNQNFASGFGSKKVEEPEKEFDEDGKETYKSYHNRNYIKLYNRANNFVKLLMAQRWVWYKLHRSSEMICHYYDWDYIPATPDTELSEMEDAVPKTKKDKSNAFEFFGL